MIGARTRGRELALQALFAWDVVDEDRARVIPQTLADAEASEEVRSFARLLVDGVVNRQPEIDRWIGAAADNWEFDRLAVVDRNILRLAVFELLAIDEVPPAVSIDQAIEMAALIPDAKYGTVEVRPIMAIPGKEG